jgi:hypothetical protein
MSSTIAQGTINASQVITRLDQNSASQYDNPQQYNAWSPSACSAASTAAVMNSYAAVNGGYTYTVGDILGTEIQLGVISANAGLLGTSGIDQTAAYYHFATHTLDKPTLDQVIAIANKGQPVIVNFPPPAGGGHWDGGHFLVVKGGNSSVVNLVDSSSLRSATASQIVGKGNGLKEMTRDDFAYYWIGVAKVITPAKPSHPGAIPTTNGGAPKQTGAYSVLGKPTMTAAQINAVLAKYQSPAAGKGQALYDLDKRNLLIIINSQTVFLLIEERQWHESLDQTTTQPNVRRSSRWPSD